MANLSPAVITKEYAHDLTVEQAGSATAAAVGVFDWGPVNVPVLVNNKNTLIEIFRKPNDSDFVDWFTAYNFLSYSNRLYNVRVAPDGSGTSTEAENATGAISVAEAADGTLARTFDGTNTTSATILNEDDFYSKEVTIQTTTDTIFIAKYVGAYGNNIKIEMVDGANFATWTHKGVVENVPSNDEVVALVFVDGEVVESFFGSKSESAKSPNGGSAYMAEIINRSSKYLWCVGGNLFTDNGSGGFSPINVSGTLKGGTNGDFGDTEDAARILGWELFEDPENIEVDFLMQGAGSSTVGQTIIQTAERRADCIAFLSPQFADVVGVTSVASAVANIVTVRNTFNSSSYAAMDGNYKYQYDPYNDVYRWIPLNGDMAGLHAKTDFERDAWWAAGGFNRGHVKNVTKLAFSPKKAYRDELYKNGVNPIATFQGEGHVLFGNKTLLSSTSSFSRINVRRLFNVLKRSIARMAKYQLFEFNDRFTRNQFTQAVNPFMREVQARRGVQAFKVVADESNNTPEVIDNYQFVGDIYVKPSKAIETIKLNFTAVKTGVEFEEMTLNGVEL